MKLVLNDAKFETTQFGTRLVRRGRNGKVQYSFVCLPSLHETLVKFQKLNATFNIENVRLFEIEGSYYGDDYIALDYTDNIATTLGIDLTESEDMSIHTTAKVVTSKDELGIFVIFKPGNVLVTKAFYADNQDKELIRRVYTCKEDLTLTIEEIPDDIFTVNNHIACGYELKEIDAYES